jgi:3D (Asp-Asp-Asp) domain-containing protein
MRAVTALILTLIVTSAICRARSKPATFEATAHTQKGVTALGAGSRVGTAAADTSVLPLGTRIRVTGAGKYSGEYTVADTGPDIKGRQIDIYVPTESEAKAFGKQTVEVQILELGAGKPATRPSRQSLELSGSGHSPF